MSDYFANLIERSFTPAAPLAVRPQLPSRFEVVPGPEAPSLTDEPAPQQPAATQYLQRLVPIEDASLSAAPPITASVQPVEHTLVESRDIERRNTITNVEQYREREVVRERHLTEQRETRVRETERVPSERILERIQQREPMILPTRDAGSAPLAPKPTAKQQEQGQPPSTTVRISIGRIEILPPAPPPRPAPPPQGATAQPARPVRSLDSFLRDRSGRRP